MRKGDKRLKYEDRKEIEKMKNDGVTYYGYEFKAHDSLEDVKATLYCYKKMEEDIERRKGKC